MPLSTFGPWTECTLDNTVHAAACGSLLKPRTRCSFIIPPGAVSGTSAPSACAMASSSCSARRTSSTPSPAGSFSSTYRQPAPEPDDASWSLPTTRNTTMHAFTGSGGRGARRFALDYLPAYSPELNPIERVWKLTRRRCLHNRYFAHLDDVIQAVESEFAAWIKPNNTLRRLCAIT